MWELMLNQAVDEGIAHFPWRGVCSLELFFFATICFIFALVLYYRLETTGKYKKIVRGIMFTSIITGIVFLTAGGIIFSTIFTHVEDTTVGIQILKVNSNVSLNSSVYVVIQINNETTIYNNSTYYDSQLTPIDYPIFYLSNKENATVVISSYYQTNNSSIPFNFNGNYNYSKMYFYYDGDKIINQTIEPVASTVDVLGSWAEYYPQFDGEDGEINIMLWVSRIVE